MEDAPLAAPEPSLLSLLPLPQDVKRSMLHGGPFADSPPPGSLELLSRWQRCLDYGTDLDGAQVNEDAVVDAARMREARERTELVWREGHAILESLAGTGSRRDFITLLTDANGIVTHSLGGGAFRGAARRLRLVEGAAWSEDLRGTNAIGTALAENRPIAVHGAAHFARTNEGLVCFAAPIRDHRGEVVAIVDVTSWEDRASTMDPTAPLLVARAIEELLRSRAYARSGGLALVERLMEHSAQAALLVEAPGRIVRANPAARAYIDRRGGEPVLPSWTELLSLADGRTRCFVENAAGRNRDAGELSVEPLVDENGGMLGLLVFLTAVERAPRVAVDPPAAVRAFDGIVGTDAALVRARELCARLARCDLPVLLLAETGTGKELFARAVHDAGARAAGPYLALNCGAIQPELVLSELFGHGPSAFTGASRAGRDGVIAAANGGTIFLDEVADLSPDAQVALLRVLEDGSYTRVGESRARRADIRVVAATSRDLDELVEAGRFRRDLYYRIGGGRVHLPALRDRDDFALLLDALWARVRLPDGSAPPRLAPAVRERLARHDWPGNVRELESALEYAAVMSEGAALVELEHLPPGLSARGPALPGVGDGADTAGSRDAALRRSLVDALRRHGGNVSAAARDLGVARSTVYRMARRHGVSLGEPSA